MIYFYKIASQINIDGHFIGFDDKAHSEAVKQDKKYQKIRNIGVGTLIGAIPGFAIAGLTKGKKGMGGEMTKRDWLITGAVSALGGLTGSLLKTKGSASKADYLNNNDIKKYLESKGPKSSIDDDYAQLIKRIDKD